MNISNEFYGFRDFVIDLFGKLIPGMLFVAFGTTVLAWPIFTVVCSGFEITLIQATIQYSDRLSKLMDAVLISQTLFIVFLAYSIGHIFYRCDIKTPDLISFKKSLAKGKIYNQKAREDLACDELKTNEYDKPYFQRIFFFIKREIILFLRLFYYSKEYKDKVNKGELHYECEYPYLYLYEYLAQRGMSKSINGLIPWHDKATLRSKNYVNILKIRIAYSAPQLHMEITRNEAHVRLSSSIWHVARTLQWTALLGLVIMLISIFSNEPYNSEIPLESIFKFYLVHAFPPLAVIFISALCRSGITSFFHQLRVREIVYILEIAHTIFRENPQKIKDIFEDYNP